MPASRSHRTAAAASRFAVAEFVPPGSSSSSSDGPHVRINIDPKSGACVGPLAALLDRLIDRVCIGSFSNRRLRRIRALGHGRACTSMGPRAVAFARLAATSGVIPRGGADCI